VEGISTKPSFRRRIGYETQRMQKYIVNVSQIPDNWASSQDKYNDFNSMPILNRSGLYSLFIDICPIWSINPN